MRDLEPEAAQGGVELGAGDTGPDDHATADGIDVEHARERPQVEHGERRAVAPVIGVDPAREARAAATWDERHVVLGAGRDEAGDALGIVRTQHEIGRRDGIAAPAAHDVGIRGARAANASRRAESSTMSAWRARAVSTDASTCAGGGEACAGCAAADAAGGSPSARRSSRSVTSAVVTADGSASPKPHQRVPASASLGPASDIPPKDRDMPGGNTSRLVGV